MMRLARPLLPVRRRPGLQAVLIGACAVLLLLAVALARASAPPPPQRMVQVVAADDATREADTARVLAVLGHQAGVSAVRRLDPAHLADLAGAAPAGQPAVPLPALIAVTLTGDADEAALARAVAPIRDASLQPADHGADASPLHRLALLAVLMAAATLVGGAIALARARLARERDTMDLLRELGADDGRILHALLQHPAIDLATGLAGALATAMLLLASAGQLGWGMAGMLAAATAGSGLLVALAGGVTAALALRRRP